MKNLNIINLKMVAVLMLLSFGFSAIAQKKDSKSKTSNTKTADPKKTTDTKTTETKTTAKTEVKAEPKLGTLKNHSKEIQKIIKNEDGVIRGYDFGTTKQKIKETEDAQYVADGKDFIIYNVKIDEKEKAEIIYYLDENDKVKGFGIAFLVNSATMAENVEATLIDDFQKYFNERYGAFKTDAKNDEVWTSKDGTYTVSMGDSSEEPEVSEIEIEIFKK